MRKRVRGRNIRESYWQCSPLSDKAGFRKDVIKALKELKISVIRTGSLRESNYESIIHYICDCFDVSVCRSFCGEREGFFDCN